MNRPSKPPPAHNLVILAGDLMAVAARGVVNQPDASNLRRLKETLDVYEIARVGDATTGDEPAPQTLRSEPGRMVGAERGMR